MAFSTVARSVVGGACTEAVPANSTSPRLIPGVNSSAKRLPAALAAANRFGATSTAAIDSDTSITSITTARVRGTRTSAVGAAIATTSSTRARAVSTAGRCRSRRRRAGATDSSTVMFANLSARLLRLRVTTTYPTTSATTGTRSNSSQGCVKPCSGSGPMPGSVIPPTRVHDLTFKRVYK
jgi:hypothetical protein